MVPPPPAREPPPEADLAELNQLVKTTRDAWLEYAHFPQSKVRARALLTWGWGPGGTWGRQR